MQDVDRPSHIQTLPEPAWARRARVESKAIGRVLSLERPDRIRRHRGSRRDVRQRAPVGPDELECAIRRAGDAIALLVNCAMMAPAEQNEIREGRRPPLGPVMQVMPLPDAYVAAREATGPIAMAQSSP